MWGSQEPRLSQPLLNLLQAAWHRPLNDSHDCLQNASLVSSNGGSFDFCALEHLPTTHHDIGAASPKRRFQVVRPPISPLQPAWRWLHALISISNRINPIEPTRDEPSIEPTLDTDCLLQLRQGKRNPATQRNGGRRRSVLP